MNAPHSRSAGAPGGTAGTWGAAAWGAGAWGAVPASGRFRFPTPVTGTSSVVTQPTIGALAPLPRRPRAQIDWHAGFSGGPASAWCPPYCLGVRFLAEHVLPGTPAAVAAVLGDPGFYQQLELPDLRLLEVRPISVSGIGDPSRADGAPRALFEDSGLVLRYEFTGDLDVVALRLLGGERPTWLQEVHLRGASGGWLRFVAEANPRLLHGRAEFFLESHEHDRRDGPDGDATGVATLRRLEGELTVALPVLGGLAERRIVAGVLRRLDVEADAAARLLVRGLRGGAAPP